MTTVIETKNGVWQGDWIVEGKPLADAPAEFRNKFQGRFTYKSGDYFIGDADCLTHRTRHHFSPTGKIEETVMIPMTLVWEYTGGFFRRDGKAGCSPQPFSPPEERDNGEPPPLAEEC